MLVGISPRWVVRLRGLAADQPLHIVNPARGLRVLLLLEHTGSLSAEETGGERVVPGKSQTQEIARPSLMAQRPPPCRGPLLCQTNPPPNPVCTGKPCLPNQSFSDPVLYGRPWPCRTKSESQASTSQLRQADRCQGKRKALARPSGARYTNRNRQPQWRPAISVAEIRSY